MEVLKMSDYILTYSKTKFYPLEPVKADIHIEDIAHALSLMTRANGHFKHFYSVAQHSINCYKEAQNRGYSTRVQLGCLLHDASESYISDITRPVKRNLPEYFVIEEKLQRTIYEKFEIGDLSEEEQKQIKDIDDALLYFEFKEVMDIELFETAPVKTMEHDFSQRDFISVEQEFMAGFNRLTSKNNIYSCVGIDGCKGQWVAVYITENHFEVEKFKTISDICNRYPDADSYIIDIPVGLAEGKNDLRPDLIVKKKLGKKGSSIFEVPCRQAVYTEDKSKARLFNIEILGKSLSEQTLGISKAIKQVDEFLQNQPKWKNKLLESHPEFCFLILNNNQPVLEHKTSTEGQQKRLSILEKYYTEAKQVVDKFLTDVPSRSKVDDVIDALCLAVMGKIILEKGIKTVPESPMMDIRGILMQIVYADCSI
jgi:predicted RNase H-like nuclease/5'-deoxynucleotidase YfbR-like HD superfamily hydrolase